MIIFITIVVRLGYCIKYPVPIRDSYKYIDFLENWNYDTSDKPYPPLALWILQTPNKFLGIDTYKGGVGINCACAVLIVILIGKVIELTTKSQRIMFIGMLFASTHPTLVDLSCHFSRDNIFFLFMILAFYFLLKKQCTKKGVYLFYAGISTGFCILSRHEGIELIMIYMIWNFFDYFKKKPKLIIQIIESGVFYFSIFISIILAIKIINVSTQYYKFVLEKEKNEIISIFQQIKAM